MPQTQTKPSKMRPQDQLVVERKAFERQRTRLLRRYAGKYVAFYGQRLTAHDSDDCRLAARMFAELGDVPFYIARVEKTPTVYDLSGPEI
jgi:hypothetical protein